MDSTLLLFFFLLILSAFFSGTEIAFFSLNPGAVRTMVRKNFKFARLVERMLKRPRRLLITILIGNNLVNIFAASIATQLAISLYGSKGIGIATGAVTLLVLVFGEIFPKTVAQTHARGISRLTALPLYILSIIMFPLVWIFIQLTNLFMHILPGARRKHLQTSEDDIRSLFHIGVEEGSVENHEKIFIERLFRFNDTQVKPIITRIENVVMLDGEKSAGKALHFAVRSGYSRFPVFVGKKGDIVGFVHIKDIATYATSDKNDTLLKNFARKPVYVDEGMLIDDVFRQMQKNYAHYLFVRDKNKKMLGIISLEDILEELIGEIYDESDKNKISAVS